VAISVALGATAVALAAAPVKGALYSGHLAAPRAFVLVKFKFSASGKKVTGLTLSNLPLYCQGGGPAIKINFKSATISKAGTFKSSGRQIISIGPFKGQVGATLSITGTFRAGRKESGKVKTTYARAPSCSGSSAYSTTA
jgi:hypothetical protein